jgi:hypothetical protein
MRRRSTAAIRLVILAFALRGLLGAECGEVQGPTWVVLVPDVSTVGTLTPFTVEVVVTSPTPIQAYEVGLQWDPDMVYPMDVVPHADFDDDGALFLTPRFDPMAGTLDRIVDLRHGGAGAEGTFHILSVDFISLYETGSTLIAVVDGGMASPDGIAAEVTGVAPLTITIEP